MTETECLTCGDKLGDSPPFCRRCGRVAAPVALSHPAIRTGPVHSAALVPLSVWTYCAPLLRRVGVKVNVGAVAEALIYFDQVFLQVSQASELDALIEWFARSNALPELTALIRSGDLKIYHYAFHTTVIENRETGILECWNLQGQDQASNGFSFVPLVLEQSTRLRALTEPIRSELTTAIEQAVTEVHADAFGRGDRLQRIFEQASTPRTAALVVQHFLDEVRPLVPDLPLRVDASVTERRGARTIRWNVDLDAVGKALGPEIGFSKHSPYNGVLYAGRLVWSSSETGLDLLLPPPLSGIAGDVLVELEHDPARRISGIVDSLVEEVDFPNVGLHVNQMQLTVQDVLRLRAAAKRFRSWLQDEAEKDRSAGLAFLEEGSAAAGMRGAKTTLNIFGVLAAAVVGGTVAPVVANVTGLEGAAAASTAATLIRTGWSSIVDSLSRTWKPVVFGKWARNHVDEAVRRNAVPPRLATMHHASRPAATHLTPADVARLRKGRR
jgi:hypothetical protein